MYSADGKYTPRSQLVENMENTQTIGQAFSRAVQLLAQIPQVSGALVKKAQEEKKI